MEVFTNGGVLAQLNIHHFQSFTVLGFLTRSKIRVRNDTLSENIAIFLAQNLKNIHYFGSKTLAYHPI